MATSIVDILNMRDIILVFTLICVLITSIHVGCGKKGKKNDKKKKDKSKKNDKKKGKSEKDKGKKGNIKLDATQLSEEKQADKEGEKKDGGKPAECPNEEKKEEKEKDEKEEKKEEKAKEKTTENEKEIKSAASSLKPKTQSYNDKQKKIKEGKKASKNQYPTMDDVVSDWEKTHEENEKKTQGKTKTDKDDEDLNFHPPFVYKNQKRRASQHYYGALVSLSRDIEFPLNEPVFDLATRSTGHSKSPILVEKLETERRDSTTSEASERIAGLRRRKKKRKHEGATPRSGFTSAWVKSQDFGSAANTPKESSYARLLYDPVDSDCNMIPIKALTRSQSLTGSITVSKSEVIQIPPLRWIDNTEAKNSVIVALSAFYAMVMTIFALVFELSHLLAAEKKRTIDAKDMCFGMYMYGISIVFLFYCYIVLLLHPRWKQTLKKFKICIKVSKVSSSESSQSLDDHSYADATIYRKVTHDSPSAGSLFLRLGAVVFGLIGTVYHAFNAFLCTGDSQDCQKLQVTMDIFSIVFIFTQMHFVFCNWKISISGSQTIARFGTMHLVAANLWTWIRYILIEEGVMDREIREIFSREGNENATPKHSTFTGHMSINHHHQHTRYCEGSECILGSLSEIMYTSMVEYSLIGAAVMFIVWRNIDHVKEPTVYVRRKHQIRMDCSKTTSGLFFGLAFLAGTFTSMAVYYGYTILGLTRVAAMVFGITDIAQYIIASFGCIYALYQMRNLRYYNEYDNNGRRKLNPNPSQELLDMILLSLGMAGEMIYSVAGLVGLTGDGNWHRLSIVLLMVHITRIAQVGLQSSLIYIAGKLRIQGDDELREKQPGKQAITFLLIANIAMFLMNLLESEKAGVSEAVVNFYGKKSWVFLVRSFSPLTIFYRFHSSVCLAEVWKNAYSWKS
ncbi:unnamed protein product [Bursaphelenchus okinawaensis]|uniref:Uncharacterized protein n=1 Tax=Bursaphelenchus okinawaensis TaxID=465554 RepID=A0A811KY34_9BILA|nr:unnamed protein product [Bursaphelenchus okinawaensis]CAG9113582.1 unnamed protein product [Bursaphelenchus okinawaensis]